MAKFYNISNIIDTNYITNYYISIDEEVHKTNIQKYLNEHPEIKTGDILFVGSTYETRQYYGFIIIDKRQGINWYHSEQGIDLPFENQSLKDYLFNNNIKYKELFDSLSKYFSDLSGYSYEKEDVAEDYHKYGIW